MHIIITKSKVAGNTEYILLITCTIGNFLIRTRSPYLLQIQRIGLDLYELKYCQNWGILYEHRLLYI
jgi:hypothetical protein